MAVNLDDIQPNVVTSNLSDKIWLFYGEMATRKTSVACSFPRHLLFAYDIGYKLINGANAVPLQNWTDFKSAVKQLDTIAGYMSQILYLLQTGDTEGANAVMTGNLGMSQEEANTIADSMTGYAKGGYVDYTGVAKVHGTPSNPEAFLSARDTSNMRAMLDSLEANRQIDVAAPSDVDGAANLIQIDEINIQTNELNTEQDFGNAGRALADEFAQAIQKRGINLNVKR